MRLYEDPALKSEVQRVETELMRDKLLTELDEDLLFAMDERGRNAREAIRLLDDISRHGSLQEGVKLDNGSTLRVELSHTRNVEQLPADLEAYKTDNRILLTAYSLQQQGRRVILNLVDYLIKLKS